MLIKKENKLLKKVSSKLSKNYEPRTRCYSLSLKEFIPLKSKIFTILIVDDDPFTQLVFTEILEKKTPEGYFFDIEKADNGKAALAIFRQRNKPFSTKAIQLIFLDCHMPLKDGYETASDIRVLIENGFLSCCIVGCSAIAEKDTGRESGMDKFIEKPVKESDLVDILLKVIK